MPLDLLHDLAPVGLIGEQPMVIAASPKLGIKSLQDLIALAKSKPGALNYAGATRGGLPNLAAESLWSRTGVSLTFVQYKGTAAALPDVAAGRVSVVIDAMSALSGAIAGETVVPLGVASAHRLPEFPNLPTVSETVPGFEAKGWFALMAPAKTEREIIEKLSRTLRLVLGQPETIAKLQALGSYTHILSPAALTNYIRDEQALWQPVVRKFGVIPQ
jgi:tripartite-type tricarboxylate transporter receptor subunit TctC